jgi:hypothetical protein
MRIVRFERLGEFPLFNPDIESPTPPAVHDLIERLNAAHGVLIASPEYAHGVTGVMKNALDWIVGCEAVEYKPVAVLNASPRATHADAALRETLTVMSACIVERVDRATDPRQRARCGRHRRASALRAGADRCAARTARDDRRADAEPLAKHRNGRHRALTRATFFAGLPDFAALARGASLSGGGPPARSSSHASASIYDRNCCR